MLKAVKVRLYPDQQQKQALAQAFGNCRWLWNYCLDLMNRTYQETGKGLSGYEVKKQIPQLKQEHEWLKLTYSQCLQQVCLNLGVAFNNFFEGRAGYPSFKPKHGRQSIQYSQNVKLVGNQLKLPMIGEIEAIIHRPIEGKIKTVTISKLPCGQYYASLLLEDGQDKPEQSTEGKAIGIDLGLTHFAITSEGSKFDNPRWFKKHERNLQIKQQHLSRRVKAAPHSGLVSQNEDGRLPSAGSNNRNKSRITVAKVHNKISRCREDFQHKLSRKLVNENQVIVVESLSVRSMGRNRSLSKAISQVGWGSFCTLLKYKAEWEGKTYLEVDRFFPSSKTCNHCLYQVSNLPLDVRSWQCSKCGTNLDRDINAAKNIRDEGLRIMTLGTRDKAYCPDVRLATDSDFKSESQAQVHSARSNRGRKKSTTPLSVG